MFQLIKWWFSDPHFLNWQKIDDESLSEGHVLVRMEGSATNDRSVRRQ